jgi:predicted nucleotidyltransferase
VLFLQAEIVQIKMDKEKIRHIVSGYFANQPVLKAWLFGSFARGEETPLSDVDILVVLDPSQHVGLKFFGMWNDLENLLDRSVDLVTEGSLAPFAVESANRDKILIYERAA